MILFAQSRNSSRNNLRYQFYVNVFLNIRIQLLNSISINISLVINNFIAYWGGFQRGEEASKESGIFQSLDNICRQSQKGKGGNKTITPPQPKYALVQMYHSNYIFMPITSEH